MEPALSFPIGKPTPSFVGIPLEVRQEIYRYLLVRPGYVSLDYNTCFIQADEETSAAVLSVSRQINEEALDVLYGENMFAISLATRDRYDTRYELTPSNWQRVRRLSLLVDDYHGYMCHTYDAPYILIEPIWPSVFANLTKLCIVADQPTKIHGDDDENDKDEDGDNEDNKDDEDNETSKVKITRWSEWLKPVLLWINERVSTDLVIELDFDGGDETAELAKVCFVKAGFRRAETELGDDELRQNEYPPECDSEDSDFGFEYQWGHNETFEYFAEQDDIDLDSDISTASAESTSEWL